MPIGRGPTRAFRLLFVAAMFLSLAGPAWSQEVVGSRVNGLVAFDISDHYITPRGLNVEDRGVVVQPLMLLFWKLRAADKGAISDVTVTTGVWNSFHSHRAGVTPSRWNEIDPILGVSMKFRQRWTAEAATTAFYTPTDSYKTSAHLDLKLTYADSFMKGVRLNPYVGYWVELNNKSTVTFDPTTSKEGSYLTLGATPAFALGTTGATVDVATYANVVSSSFYQRFDGSDGGSGLAVFSVAPKVSVPLKFMGLSHGAWTAYGGIAYLHLSNDGLLDGNQVLRGTADRQPNLTRLRAGLSVFF